MFHRKISARFVAALVLLGSSLMPLAANAEPMLRDRRLFVWDRVVVELGTFGVAGALVRFTPEKGVSEKDHQGIAIESAKSGAMVSYRSSF